MSSVSSVQNSSVSQPLENGNREKVSNRISFAMKKIALFVIPAIALYVFSNLPTAHAGVPSYASCLLGCVVKESDPVICFASCAPLLRPPFPPQF